MKHLDCETGSGGRHPLTLEAQVQFQASLHGICGAKVTFGHVCLQVLDYHSTDAPYSFMHVTDAL